MHEQPSSHHHGSVADQSGDLCGDVCAGGRRTVAGREDYRLCKGRLCAPDHTHGRRAPRDATVDLFGVSLDAFMVAGGGVLAWMRFSMLSGQPAAGDSRSKQSLTPLILFAASPGDHYRSHYALRCAHPDDIAAHLVDRYRGGYWITWLAMLLVAHFGGNRRGAAFCATRSRASWELIVPFQWGQFALTGYRSFMR
jgi:hypothetical protein